MPRAGVLPDHKLPYLRCNSLTDCASQGSLCATPCGCISGYCRPLSRIYGCARAPVWFTGVNQICWLMSFQRRITSLYRSLRSACVLRCWAMAIRKLSSPASADCLFANLQKLGRPQGAWRTLASQVSGYSLAAPARLYRGQ